MKDKLKVLALWLKNAESEIDLYHDGHLEAAFKRAKQETKQEIGDLLQEILNMSDEEVIEQIKQLGKEETEYPF